MVFNNSLGMGGTSLGGFFFCRLFINSLNPLLTNRMVSTDSLRCFVKCSTTTTNRLHSSSYICLVSVRTLCRLASRLVNNLSILYSYSLRGKRFFFLREMSMRYCYCLFVLTLLFVFFFFLSILWGMVS